MKAIEGAKQAGATIIDRGPLSKGSMAITDAIIYRELASELGRLPPAVISEVVSFYGRALEIGRIAEMGSSALDSYATLHDLAPRVRIGGALVIRLLEKFEQSDFAVDADLKPTREEVLELAKRVDYPIEIILKERGFKI